MPLDVTYEMDRPGARLAPAWFAHSAARERYTGGAYVAAMGVGRHFTDVKLPWNRACS